MQPNLPPLLRTDVSNPFAHDTMKRRVPAIIRETQALNDDYPPSIQSALDRLRSGLETNAAIPFLNLPTPDYEDWLPLWKPHEGVTWQYAEWFFAEVFFYRLLIQAVRWWETGRDPFAPKKREEFLSSALWEALGKALATRELPLEERLRALLHADLWGNRIDLSMDVARAHGSAGASDDVVVDHSDQIVAHVLRWPGERIIHFINDNAGTELAMDLALADALLDGTANIVVFHLKMHPTYVSDATPADVRWLLELAETRANREFRSYAKRLRSALDVGRLRLIPDLFWNRSQWMWDMPQRISKTLDGAALTLVKGDANYRRSVGDALWPHDTSYAEIMSYFPTPVAQIRTFKSDVIVGLPGGLAQQLDGIDAEWRVNGKRGVIQAARLR